MIEATSCGGVVIFRGKILLLYKNYKHRYDGWVLPKGTVEAGEEYKETALREVKEETNVAASIIKYVGKSQYTFNTPNDTVVKDVHWYLMMADSYHSISIMKHIICSNFQMKSRYWKKHIANILILKEVIYGEVISIFKVNAFR